MEGTFKKLASITAVLTVGVLTATGVGPRYITSTAQSLLHSESVQSSGYALGEFFNQFAPAHSDQSLDEATRQAPIRLASLAMEPRLPIKADLPHIGHSIADFDSTDVGPAQLDESIEITLSPTLAAFDAAPQIVTHTIFKGDFEDVTARQIALDSYPVKVDTAARRRLPLSYRLITVAAKTEVGDLPCSILRMIGITSRARFTRIPLIDGDSALFISCTKPAS